MDEESLFHLALGKPPAERAAFLEQACGGDAALRRHVEALLRAHETPGSFLARPALESGETLDSDANRPHPETAVVQPTAEESAERIGPYKLLQQLGEGGMGTVWLAEQREPVQRRVALKIIKPGMDSRQVLARFEAERQALALMDHPNIARVFDGGTTANGRPYFVMELIKGVPITRWCDEHHLTPRQRLELFIPVCQAVQHAHQKGIIHRDLKPSNVLLALYDGKPVPKVIDFGIAKATGMKLTERTLFTELGAVIGTLEYMSPEQAELNQLDIDTRSDVYSLGVLFYELLTGTTPLQRKRLKEAALVEALRLIREEEPPRPSTRLSTTQELPAIAANRGLEPHKLSGLVRGELDWIVMKALEKDRDRRYESANGLARDVERYLADEPVQACPPSASYRLRKFVRRNKGPVLAAALVLVSLVAGMIGSLYFAFQAERFADKADARARDYLEEKGKAEKAAGEAVAERNQARYHLYVTRMAPVSRLWQEGKCSRVLELLEEQRPRPDRRDEPDLRGWEWHYQWRLSHGALRTFTGHRSGRTHSDLIGALAFSPDGRWLASGRGPITDHGASDCGELILWDLAAGRELRRLVGHPLQITHVAFSPDGQRLASASWDRTVKLWDVADGRLLHTLEGHLDRVDRVAFSPDGKTLASADNVQIMGPNDAWKKSHAIVKLWDVASGRPLHTWRTDVISLLAFVPDGRLLTVARYPVARPTVRLHEAATGKELQSSQLPFPTSAERAAVAANGRRLAVAGPDGVRVGDLFGPPGPLLKGHTQQECNALAFSPDGRRLASAGEDGTVKLWDLQDPRPQPETVTLRGLEAGAASVAFSTDGRRLAAAGNGLVCVWDTGDTGQEMRSFREAQGVRCPLFTPDGKRLLALESSGTMPAAWDAVSGHKLPGPPDGGGPVAYSPDGRWLASGCRTGIRLWDADTCREVRTIRSAHRPTLLTFAPDGRLASATPAAPGVQTSAVQVWDAASGQELLTLLGHARVVTGLAFSPDGHRLAAVSHHPGQHAQLNVWDTATGEGLLTWEVHVGLVVGLAFSADGRLLATAGEDETWGVKLWDANTGKKVRAIPWPTGVVRAVAFSPDGRRLAVLGDEHVKVWDLAGWAEVFSYVGQRKAGLTLAWSPDGRWLASGDFDQTIKVWDLATGRERLALKGTTGSGEGHGLAFSPDGRRVASGGTALRVWDAVGGEELHSPAGHAGAVLCMALSPDGRLLATGGLDQVVRLWDARSWSPLGALPGHSAPVRAIAFGPDGRRLASGAGEFKKPGEVRVWDLPDGREPLRLQGHPDWVIAVAFSPDGRLVSVSGDGTLKVWDAEGQELQTGKVVMEGRPGIVRGAALSPNDRLLACVGDDSRVRLWDLSAGREARPLTGHTEKILTAVAFSPDSQRLASAGEQGETRLWDVVTGQELYTLPNGNGALAFSPDGGRLAMGGSNLALVDGRPLTPELAIEREALGLLDHLFSQPLPRQAILRELRTDPTLSEAVRQQALWLADHYRE
jgi:WD40 repeat protein/serine/threonine protein kinase